MKWLRCIPGIRMLQCPWCKGTDTEPTGDTGGTLDPQGEGEQRGIWKLRKCNWCHCTYKVYYVSD